MLVTTKDPKTIDPFLSQLSKRKEDSHKGQNGRLLIIGGSGLFHAASIWSAAIASKIVDIVHYSSTVENEHVFLTLKKKFLDGIVIKKEDLDFYIKEDDCILIGPGMVRGARRSQTTTSPPDIHSLLAIADEATYTREIVRYVAHTYPDKRFVFDGGALQMMDPKWLLRLKTRPILTPHAGEFERLFGHNVATLSLNQQQSIVTRLAKKYRSIIVLKVVRDIISDGDTTITVEGGNAGLTKGGTGDTLAGLLGALATTQDPLTSAVVSSYIIKKTAEHLFTKSHFWYNTSDLINEIPHTFSSLTQ